MPYPAWSTDGVNTGPWVFRDNTGWTTYNSAPFMRTKGGNPASTSNPIRPDGTRPMSAWRRYGGWWRVPSNCFGRMASGPYWKEQSGCYSVPLEIDPASLQVWGDAKAHTRLKALATWADRQVEYSDALRTAGQTAQMVGDLGKGLAGQLEEAMGRRGWNPARNWKQLPGWYLEYLYGWRPLMEDISNATDRLIKAFDSGASLSVYLKAKNFVWENRTTSNLGGVWGTYFNVDNTWLIHQLNKCVMRYNIPTDRLTNLQPTGFFGGLWEAKPYSFVLDWVAPVGTWLRALDANALAIYFVEGCSSEMVKVHEVQSNFRTIGSSGWNVELHNYATSIVQKPFNFTRSLETPWSITSRVPIRTDLSLQHAAQGLALLTGQLKRMY